MHTLARFRVSRSLEDGKEGGEEVDLDAGDGGEAEEAIFDLGGELGGGGFVGGGGVEGDAGEEARGEPDGEPGASGSGVRVAERTRPAATMLGPVGV